MKRLTFSIYLRSIFTIVLILPTMFQSHAIYVDIGKYTYDITRFWGSGANGDTQAMIVGIAAGEKVTGDVVLPDSISYNGNRYPVVGLGEGDFSGIDEGINPAFYYNDEITSITIPVNCRFIAGNEFIGCHNIEKYYVAPGNKNYIAEDGLLYELNYSYDQEKVTYELFRYPSARTATTLAIPAKATTVGTGAFAANNHIKVIILSGEQSLNSKWQLGNKTIENVDCKSSRVYSSPEDGVLIYNTTFKGVCPGLTRTTYTIPDNILFISEGAFCESSIREVTIPASVTNPLSQYEFLNSSIESLKFNGNIPNSIPQGCFINAVNLKYLPMQGDDNGKLWLSSSCFLNCKSLENISFDENIKSIRIARNAFMGCSKLKEFPVTSKMRISELNSYAFSGCRSLTGFSFGTVDEIENVPGHQFESSGLTYVNWPSAFPKVPYSCFKDCRDLTKVNLKMTTTDLNADAFSGSGLTAISMMGVEWYGDTSFYNCPDLSRVYFPANENEYAYYRDIEFIPSTAEVIVNNPHIRNLDNQRPNEKSEVKLYMSMFTTSSVIGDGWSVVYVPGRAKDIYSSLTNSEVREMYTYTTDKQNSKVKIGYLAAGVRLTGVTIEGKDAELQDGWWCADVEPSEGIKMNVSVNYTVYGNPMTTNYEYRFEDSSTAVDNLKQENEAIIDYIDNIYVNLKKVILWNIYDLGGRKIKTGVSDKIEKSELLPGTYILNFPTAPHSSVKLTI